MNKENKEFFPELSLGILEEIKYILDQIFKKIERAGPNRLVHNITVTDNLFPEGIDEEDYRTLLKRIERDSGGAITFEYKYRGLVHMTGIELSELIVNPPKNEDVTQIISVYKFESLRNYYSKIKYSISRYDFDFEDEKEEVESNAENLKDVNNQKYSKFDYWVEIKNTREIVLNNKYILTKPNFASENDDFFAYICQHADEKILKKEIEEEIKTKLKKTLHQIINDLGFKAEIKKMFFPNISKDAVQFKNNIVIKNLSNIKINQKKLKSQLKELRVWKDKK